VQAEVHALADVPRTEADLRRRAAAIGPDARSAVDLALAHGWWTQVP
jgi:hypothetical protein